MSDSAMGVGKLGINGCVRLAIEVVKSLAHGEGTQGNVQAFRRERVLLPDGTERWVPKISGVSLRNRLRCWSAMYALEQMGIPEDATLSKRFWSMALSGGALTSGGGSIKIDRYRELNAIFPVMGLMGYGAGNYISEGSIAVDDIDFVCEENREMGRIPSFATTGLISLPAGALMDEEMRTRKDVGNNPVVRRFLPPAEVAETQARLDGRKEAKTAEEAKGDSDQMIYSYETIVAGAQGYSRIFLRNTTQAELVALLCGLAWGTLYTLEDGRPVYGIGGKTKQGHGRIAVTFSSTLREGFEPMIPREAAAMLHPDASWLEPLRTAYNEGLARNKDQIIATLEAIA